MKFFRKKYSSLEVKHPVVSNNYVILENLVTKELCLRSYYMAKQSQVPHTVHELHFVEGDILEIENYAPSKWTIGRLLNGRRIGLVYTDCLISRSIHDFQPWYFPDTSKEESRVLLRQQSAGTFLIRPSTHSIGHSFSLDIRFQDDSTDGDFIIKYKIFSTALGFWISPHLYFNSLELLIAEYLSE